MYIYHVFINALSAHMIHINLNMIFYTHVEHSPTKTIDIKYYKNTTKTLHTHTTTTTTTTTKQKQKTLHTHVYEIKYTDNRFHGTGVSD